MQMTSPIFLVPGESEIRRIRKELGSASLLPADARQRRNEVE